MIKKPIDGSVWATEKLFEYEKFHGQVYVPDRNDNGIENVIVKHGGSTFNTSIGFLDYDARYPNVIGEPPPKLAHLYVKKAIDVSFDKVAFLLPVNFMHTQKTKTLFDETCLIHVYILTKRIVFRPSIMAWFVWQKNNWAQTKLKLI
jgi:hypothetical protein